MILGCHNDKIIDKNCRGYFTFFIVVTVVASLNDYWKILKLDVLFAPDKKKDNSKLESNETNDQPDDSPESTNQDENKNEIESTPTGNQFFNFVICLKLKKKFRTYPILDGIFHKTYWRSFVQFRRRK